MILVDTSVWVDHLRAGEARLAAALETASVWTHPFIIGELACGTLRKRDEILALLAALPQVPTATDAEALAFIDSRRLMGRGIGYIDVHLLAAAALSGGVLLWTFDRKLAAVADDLGLGIEV